MKVVFAYLPAANKTGFLCLSQNRFAKVRGDRELIYPLIPASGLTLLDNAGYITNFIDSIYDSLGIEIFLSKLESFNPDLLIFETKTPTVKQNWKDVSAIKERLPELKIAAVGDHVSVLPVETLENSEVDYIITGGDYDVGMLNLADYVDTGKDLACGIFYKEKGQIKNTGDYELIKTLDSLPFINRDIIPWEHYHESWRLYDRFMYMMGSRGCPYKCTFCSWPQMLYKGSVRYRSVSNMVDEMEMLIDKYKVQEIFFDDDNFTTNKKGVINISKEILERGLDIIWDCNGRVDNVDRTMLTWMKKSGCRLIKFGVESASQKTLDKIQKGYTIAQVRNGFKVSKEVKILRHATVMLGFPWETYEDIRDTIEFVKELEPDTAQFSIPIAYPGTKLFEEAKEKGLLMFKSGMWEKYDMSSPILKNENINPDDINKFCEKAWKEVYFRPKFIIHKFLTIRNFAQLKWLYRGTKSVLKGHISPLKSK